MSVKERQNRFDDSDDKEARFWRSRSRTRDDREFGNRFDDEKRGRSKDKEFGLDAKDMKKKRHHDSDSESDYSSSEESGDESAPLKGEKKRRKKKKRGNNCDMSRVNVMAGVYDFIGVFMLTCVFALSVYEFGSVWMPFAFFAAITVLTFIFWCKSYSHLNPLISWSFFFLHPDVYSFINAVYRTIGGFLGAFSATFLVQWVGAIPAATLGVVPAAGTALSVWTTYIMEGVFAAFYSLTFLTMWKALTSSKKADGKGKRIGGLFMGVVVGLVNMSALFLLPNSNMYNPAIASGLVLVGSIYGSSARVWALWIYWAADLCGIIIAVIIYFSMEQKDFAKSIYNVFEKKKKKKKSKKYEEESDSDAEEVKRPDEEEQGPAKLRHGKR